MFIKKTSTKYEHHGYKILCFTHFIEMNGLEACVTIATGFLEPSHYLWTEAKLNIKQGTPKR